MQVSEFSPLLAPFAQPKKQQCTYEFFNALMRVMHEAAAVFGDCKAVVRERQWTLPPPLDAAGAPRSVLPQLAERDLCQEASWVSEAGFLTQCTSTTCSRCGHTTHLFETETALRLGVHPEALSFEETLARHFAPAQAMRTCDACCKDEQVPVTIESKLVRVGPCLVAFTNRIGDITYEEQGGVIVENQPKIMSEVDIPEDLDISPVCDAEALAMTGSQAKYRLTGVVHHRGPAQYGHYWAVTRGVSDNVWRCFNDHRVAEVDSPAGPSDTAIMLFYSRA